MATNTDATSNNSENNSTVEKLQRFTEDMFVSGQGAPKIEYIENNKMNIISQKSGRTSIICDTLVSAFKQWIVKHDEDMFLEYLIEPNLGLIKKQLEPLKQYGMAQYEQQFKMIKNQLKEQFKNSIQAQLKLASDSYEGSITKIATKYSPLLDELLRKLQKNLVTTLDAVISVFSKDKKIAEDVRFLDTLILILFNKDLWPKTLPESTKTILNDINTNNENMIKDIQKAFEDSLVGINDLYKKMLNNNQGIGNGHFKIDKSFTKYLNSINKLTLKYGSSDASTIENHDVLNMIAAKTKEIDKNNTNTTPQTKDSISTTVKVEDTAPASTTVKVADTALAPTTDVKVADTALAPTTDVKLADTALAPTTDVKLEDVKNQATELTASLNAVTTA